MTDLSRRCFIAATVAPLAMHAVSNERTSDPATIGFGFGTYGMKALGTSEAIRVCAEIGYDGIEFSLMSGWPTDPTTLSRQQRREIRHQLNDTKLAVPSLVESLPCLRTQEDHSSNIEKLKRATELAHQLSPEKAPIVQSIVGGRISQWEKNKQKLAEQLSDWARVGEASQTVVCFKPHAAHIVNHVERALWIHNQVNSRWLKLVYDYSHFYLEGYSLSASLKELLPVTAYVQVKDSRGTPEKHNYLLPGDGETDYAELLTILKKADYSGFVNVEVSSMIHRKPEYQPVSTARLCYKRLAPIFKRVGIHRPRRD